MTENKPEMTDVEFEAEATNILREIETGSARFASQISTIRKGLNTEIRTADEALISFATEVTREDTDEE